MPEKRDGRSKSLLLCFTYFLLRSLLLVPFNERKRRNGTEERTQFPPIVFNENTFLPDV